MKTLSVLERKVYDTLRSEYPGKVISPFTLRLEDKIENAKSKYMFKLLDEDGNRLKSELRLNKNDVIFVTSSSLAMYQRNATNAASPSECVEVVQTYPNTTYFTTGGVFTIAHLEIFYNARLYLQVGNVVYVPGKLTRDFRYVPETQQTALTNKSQWGEGGGFVEEPTYYRLRGIDQTEIWVEIQPFTGMAVENDQANTENRLVLFLKGFIIKQGARLKAVSEMKKAA